MGATAPCFAFVLVSLLVGGVFGAESQNQTGSSSSDEATQVEWIAVNCPAKGDCVDLIRSRYIDIDHFASENEIWVYASDEDIAFFREMGWSYRSLDKEFAEIYRQRKLEDAAAAQIWWESRRRRFTYQPPQFVYHDSVMLERVLKDMQANYPQFLSLVSIGKSVQNRDIWVMEVSTNPGVHEAKPYVNYIANMHGDETVGRELLVHFIDYLCSEYLAGNTRVQALMNGTKIFLLPSMNPDGFESKTRYNSRNVDLNRDFPDQFVSNDQVRQPETLAVMNWVTANKIILSANFHGGAVVASYPWDGTPSGSSYYSKSPDDDAFRMLASEYVKYSSMMKSSSTFGSGITNGAAWYSLYGGMQDWGYISTQKMDITLEVSEIKYPSASTLSSFWNGHKDSLLAYLEAVNKYGVRGVVRDHHGRPIEATISISELPKVVFYSRADFGDYYRILNPKKNYTIVFEADGCFPQNFTAPLASAEYKSQVFYQDVKMNCPGRKDSSGVISIHNKNMLTLILTFLVVLFATV